MSGSPESQQRIKALLQSALKLDPAARASFLDRACAGDLSVRQEVESRLAAYDQATGSVGPSLPEVATEILAGESAAIVGTTIAHYRILSFLGRGGMGEVYLAQDTKLGRKVALKLLPISLNSDEERLRRFEREARSASALNHPNVSVIHEIGETEEGRHFIAMEHIDGVTLRRRLKEGPLTLTEAIDIAVQIAAALSAAHHAGVVHRDIKPENVMLRHDGYVKVLDFGLAKLTERYDLGSDSEAPTFHAFSTHSGLLIGTANYLSPEQARRQEADERSDIWSLGVVLYEIVTGSLPFIGDTPSHTIVAILERDPTSLTQLLPTAPTELEWVVKKAIRKDPEQRYQTVKEMLGDLNEVKQRMTVSASGRPLIMTRKSQERAATQHSSALESISETLRRPRVSIAFLIVIGLILAAASWPLFRWYTKKSAVPFQNMRITKLTNTGQSLAAAVSPDGKYVAQVVNEGGQQSLVVNYTATASNVVVATPSDARYLGLTFSHDGNYIYFVRNEKNDVGLLYQVPVVGGMTNKIMSNVDSPITLSPDDKQLAFVRYNKGEGEYSLMVSEAGGIGERKLASRRNGDRFSIEGAPDWSPDGKAIICADGSFAGGFHMNVVVVQVADGAEKSLPLPKWYGVLQALWVKDGSGVIIAAAEQSVSQIQLWYAPYPSGEAQRITNDSNDYISITLTANSNDLVAIQKNRQKAIWIAPNGDANQARQVATAVGNTYGLAWASDARMIYSTMASGKLDLWSIRADGNGRTQLTVNAGSNYHPAVSPDGNFIVFASNRTGTFNIWRMDADGSNSKQLTSGGSDFYPDVSPDGRWVVYQSGGGASGKPTLWKVPIDGGQVAQLTDLNTSVPAVSPDGRLIACRFWDEGDSSKKVAVVSFAGGHPIKTFGIPIHDWQRIRWTPDASALTYVDIRGGVSNIWRQPLDGRPASQLTFFKADQIFSYDWSKDGKLLACERGLETTDVVVISSYK